MSDFSQRARCPGCGRMMCPDDGGCCVQCERCKRWIGPYEQNLQVVSLAEARRPTGRGGRARCEDICTSCMSSDVPADLWDFKRNRYIGDDPWRNSDIVQLGEARGTVVSYDPDTGALDIAWHNIGRGTLTDTSKLQLVQRRRNF